jgi:hypothetical protein
MGGESPFFVTARLLPGRLETCNKHISKSLYQFSTHCPFPRRDYLLNPDVPYESGGYRFNKAAEIDHGKTARFLH